MDVLKESTTFVPQENIYPHDGWVDRDMRNRLAGHKSGVVWLTGLSGAGKSTLARLVNCLLFEANFKVKLTGIGLTR